MDRYTDQQFNWNIAMAVQAACILEADAPKVGNVNRFHDFKDCTLEDFHISALAIAQPFALIGKQGVGMTIYQAIKATRSVVKTNTNLGIVLLLAPLALAFCKMQEHKAKDANSKNINMYLASTLSLCSKWRNSLHDVLENLTAEDTDYVYKAIRLASPTGMGTVDEQDVNVQEREYLPLKETMSLAAKRDLIAQQYIDDFETVFSIGFPYFSRVLDKGIAYSQAIAHTHLFLLTEYPDSLISRKFGQAKGREVQQKAQEVWRKGGLLTLEGQEATKEFDYWLRNQEERLNPGTTADLIAAIIFVQLLSDERINQKINTHEKGGVRR